MDDVQKSRILLSHWIDHNLDHLKGYVDTADLLEKLGYAPAAENIRQSVELIKGANDRLQEALSVLPEPEGDEPGGHHGHHHHSH